MGKIKFVSVFVLLALLLSAGPGTVMGQEQQPPNVPTPTEPTIIERTRLEWGKTVKGSWFLFSPSNPCRPSTFLAQASGRIEPAL